MVALLSFQSDNQRTQCNDVQCGSRGFVLHEFCKLVTMASEKLGLGDAVLRRILNHTAPKGDVLHRHYVGLNEGMWWMG